MNNIVEIERYLSSGTIKGIVIFTMVREILREGGYLVIDEIENHFNKEIVSTLIRFFKDKQLNKKGGVLFFSMMAIPVLTACFSEVKALYKSGGEDLQVVLDNYKWFRAVMKSYRKEKGRDLSEEDFDSIQPLDLAQIVFNYSSVNGIDKFYALVNNVGGDEDE